MEAVCLGIFMISAAGFTVLLQHPASPLSDAGLPPVTQRLLIGVAMGITLAAIVYSPIGSRSGAHMNPAVTLTFLRLGKIERLDACGYVAGQFTGGAAGIIGADWIFRGLPAHPAVHYIATVPGPGGSGVAFIAEAAISFGMMMTVLSVSNAPRIARFTGACAAVLVATCITLEAPLSGTSMNAARSFAPALLASTEQTLWIYFTAPLLGMLLAAQSFVAVRGQHRVRCAKLHHRSGVRCIFRCGFARTETGVSV
jgi:aquaporin Z